MKLDNPIKPTMRKFILTLLIALGLAGCNTMEGVGKDVEAAGENIEEAAED